MIKLRRHKRIYTEIGLVSATDVMSLLLIFCMLMVSSGALTTLNVSLPTSKSVENSSKEIVVTITSSLEYYIDGQKVHKDELRLRDEEAWRSPSCPSSKSHSR